MNIKIQPLICRHKNTFSLFGNGNSELVGVTKFKELMFIFLRFFGVTNSNSLLHSILFELSRFWVNPSKQNCLSMQYVQYWMNPYIAKGGHWPPLGVAWTPAPPVPELKFGTNEFMNFWNFRTFGLLCIVIPTYFFTLITNQI